MSRQTSTPTRENGYVALDQYIALGDGRSVALSATDGSIDWWCAPNMDSPPLFDKVLSADKGGYFSLTPRDVFTVERDYLPDSNVAYTVFKTATGSVRLTESLNSGNAGRLPWSELARRLEGVEGQVEFEMVFRPGTRADSVSPWIQDTRHGKVFHITTLMVMLRMSPEVVITEYSDRLVRAQCTVRAGQRVVFAVLASDDEPFAVPTLEQIDARIELSDGAWRNWTETLGYSGAYATEVRRSALALKLLLYSPSGAIAAAATSSLPEKIGSDRNYDYRYAWVRDAAYSIKALLRIGALQEAKAAFAWLIAAIRKHGPRMHVCYTLDAERVDDVQQIPLSGYQNSPPVVIGNSAFDQLQLSLYGDILETAKLFVDRGHLLDESTAQLLHSLADQCADEWNTPDAGIWELPEQQHYTISKIGCWVALDRASKLAEAGQIPDGKAQRWARERDRVRDWIDEHCWSHKMQAYTMYPGTDRLDASLLLAARFGFERRDRIALTRDAVVQKLGAGETGVTSLLYRYSGAQGKEGCFLACSFWLVEAYALLNELPKGRQTMDALLSKTMGNSGVMAEMLDPDTGQPLGNFPQGLSHLTLVHAALACQGE
ncbi:MULTISPECIES: glycoside hydrolase family 15 protein [unclassified Pseudomonas]|uniref:glycoside hydrolase family 15 protein n=1 Tax=unclassified Pseudomonas TaxID=196821 RepID=UPI0025ECDE2E|nr:MULTISPECIES: glycoside hydrolase family 15 protein [unclassified Pseudomonas]